MAGWTALGAWLAGAIRIKALNGFDCLRPLREGGVAELDMYRKEGLPVALAVSGLLRRSAATLASVNFRQAANGSRM